MIKIKNKMTNTPPSHDYPLNYEIKQAPGTAVGTSRRKPNLFDTPDKHVADKGFELSQMKHHNLPVRLVAGIKEPGPFGFEPYTVPKHGSQPRVTSFAPSKSKNFGFMDQAAKDWKWVPAGIYIKHSEWDKTAPKTGKWGTYKKISFTESVMTQEKSKPSPANYQTFNLHQEKILCALNL